MKKCSGFSLIELMVVIAIIAFMTMISVPSFARFLSKAKRTEAYTNLHSIYAAQKAYWAEHGKYSTQLLGADGIGWQPEGYKGGGAQEKFYYTYGFSNGAEGINYFTGKLNTSNMYLTAGHADANSFTVVAAADLNGNGNPDILTIDQNNAIEVVQDGL
jgi:prepilin-type N-terminal cleavage/methylation domain-containing protein